MTYEQKQYARQQAYAYATECGLQDSSFQMAVAAYMAGYCNALEPDLPQD